MINSSVIKGFTVRFGIFYLIIQRVEKYHIASSRKTLCKGCQKNYFLQGAFLKQCLDRLPLVTEQNIKKDKEFFMFKHGSYINENTDYCRPRMKPNYKNHSLV